MPRSVCSACGAPDPSVPLRSALPAAPPPAHCPSLAAITHRVQADSRYDPVRTLLSAAPSRGVPRYDFARSLVRSPGGCVGGWKRRAAPAARHRQACACPARLHAWRPPASCLRACAHDACLLDRRASPPSLGAAAAGHGLGGEPRREGSVRHDLGSAAGALGALGVGACTPRAACSKEAAAQPTGGSICMHRQRAPIRGPQRRGTTVPPDCPALSQMLCSALDRLPPPGPTSACCSGCALERLCHPAPPSLTPCGRWSTRPRCCRWGRRHGAARGWSGWLAGGRRPARPAAGAGRHAGTHARAAPFRCSLMVTPVPPLPASLPAPPAGVERPRPLRPPGRPVRLGAGAGGHRGEIRPLEGPGEAAAALPACLPAFLPACLAASRPSRPSALSALLGTLSGLWMGSAPRGTHCAIAPSPPPVAPVPQGSAVGACRRLPRRPPASPPPPPPPSQVSAVWDAKVEQSKYDPLRSFIRDVSQSPAPSGSQRWVGAAKARGAC